ncbi:MAG: pyruvate formate-lyase-activating protein [Clostridia bacterium]
MNGIIHSIESLSTVDGPGMRFVVFMQGCNLRCKFCHNPDTWAKDSGKSIEEEELLKKIIRSKEFLNGSNGGVTFTGGEPLLQIDFLLEICPKIHEAGIHIAVDTSGNFPLDEKIQKLANYVDLFLIDIKHINKEKHKWITGVDPSNILKFTQYITNIRKIPTWIRIVYMPGITDEGTSIEDLKTYIQTLSSVEKVEVLPYHEMGKYKWKELNIPYTLENIRIPTKEECTKLSKYIFKEQKN